MESKGFLLRSGGVIRYRRPDVIGEVLYREQSYNLRRPCTVRTWLVHLDGLDRPAFEASTRSEAIRRALAAWADRANWP